MLSPAEVKGFKVKFLGGDLRRSFIFSPVELRDSNDRGLLDPFSNRVLDSDAFAASLISGSLNHGVRLSGKLNSVGA